MPSALPSIGFQAVILCGAGEGLHPFAGDENLVPKALLQVANKPMIYYPIEWCEKAGISCQ
jgi:translation initiation factor eIF-2B subunit gamma